MGRLNKKLSTFDGAALNITTYAQLTTAAQFVNSYKANLGKAIKAWNGLIKTARNSERHKNLSARKAYFDALVKAFKEKAKVIKPPKKVAPKVVRKITLDEIYVGPDAGGDKPYLLDIHGREQTLFRAWGSPGSKSKPSRWSAKVKF